MFHRKHTPPGTLNAMLTISSFINMSRFFICLQFIKSNIGAVLKAIESAAYAPLKGYSKELSDLTDRLLQKNPRLVQGDMQMSVKIENGGLEQPVGVTQRMFLSITVLIHADWTLRIISSHFLNFVAKLSSIILMKSIMGRSTRANDIGLYKYTKPFD